MILRLDSKKQKHVHKRKAGKLSAKLNFFL